MGGRARRIRVSGAHAGVARLIRSLYAGEEVGSTLGDAAAGEKPYGENAGEDAAGLNMPVYGDAWGDATPGLRCGVAPYGVIAMGVPAPAPPCGRWGWSGGAVSTACLSCCSSSSSMAAR